MDIRVVVFEDNKLVRDALQAILSGTPGFSCTGAYPDSHNWEINLKRSTPDVILMDIEMPGMNGIELTKLIMSKQPTVKVLIHTVFNDSEKIFLALCAGASGYILKNDPPHKYLEAINEVVNGGAPVSSTVAKKILGFFTNKNIEMADPSEGDYRLSNRERELLKLMIAGHGYRTIGEKLFISYETVRTHVKHIYKKLHVASRSEAVLRAIRDGIR